MIEPPPDYRMVKLYFPHNNEQCWMILGPTFQTTSKIFLNHLFWNIHFLLKHIWVPKLYKYPRITLRPHMRRLSSVFLRSTGAPIGLSLDNEKRLCSVGPGPEKKTINLQDAFWMSRWALFGLFLILTTWTIRLFWETYPSNSFTHTCMYIYI